MAIGGGGFATVAQPRSDTERRRVAGSRFMPGL
jgi:hypothetical protein